MIQLFDPISYTQAKKAEKEARTCLDESSKCKNMVKKLRIEGYILFFIGILVGFILNIISKFLPL